MLVPRSASRLTRSKRLRTYSARASNPSAAAGLVDVFRPGAGVQFRENLTQPLQLSCGPLPLDLQQATQQFGNRLPGLDVFPRNHGQLHKAAIDRTADVAHAGGVDRADKRLPCRQLPAFNLGDDNRHGRWRLRRPCGEGRPKRQQEPPANPGGKPLFQAVSAGFRNRQADSRSVSPTRLPYLKLYTPPTRFFRRF